jgi:ABC-type spermidine/putrescine transport system permease subunit II
MPSMADAKKNRLRILFIGLAILLFAAPIAILVLLGMSTFFGEEFSPDDFSADRFRTCRFRT